MIKILFVTNYLCQGGVEKSLINLLNSLDKKIYEINVLCIVKKNELANQINHEINVKYIFNDNIRGVDKLFKYIPTNILYRLFIRQKYDVEVAYSDGKATKLIGNNPVSKTKKFAWIHQDLERYDKLMNCYKSWDEYRQSYSQFNKVFCVSSKCRESYSLKIGYNNTEILYNIIPKSIINKANEKIKLFDKRLKLITVGRLSQEKGQLRLLKILKKLMDEGYEFVYLIVGDGPQREMIEKYITENAMNKYIYMTGFTENPYKYMSKSDLFICPSYTEALSTTCIESLILNIPVLSTNVPGADEIIDMHYGMIVSNDDKSIYEGIKKILNNQDMLLQWKIADKNLSKFDERIIIERLNNYFM